MNLASVIDRLLTLFNQFVGRYRFFCLIYNKENVAY